MRPRFLLFVAACSMLAACGGHALDTAAPAPAAPAGPAAAGMHARPAVTAALLYVADASTNTVDEFFPTDNGNVTPFSTISGPDTGLGLPHGVAVGIDGSIYVSNDALPGSVTVYGPGSSGDAVPARTITCGGLKQPAGMSLDAAGNLYVANSGGKSISIFSPTDSGCVSGNQIISGAQTCIFEPNDVDLRDDGQIYVASSASVLVFSAGAHGNVSPIQKIAGSNTQLLGSVRSVSLDSSFDIFVASASQHQAGRITVYSPTATGNVAPIRRISGAATTLGAVQYVELDPIDQAYVSNGADVDVFAAGASANTAPLQIISGPSTTLVNPLGLDITP